MVLCFWGVVGGRSLLFWFRCVFTLGVSVRVRVFWLVGFFWKVVDVFNVVDT